MIRALAVIFMLCNVANGQVITLNELRVITFEDKTYHVHVQPWHVWHEEKDGEISYELHPKHGLCTRIGEWHAWLICPSVLYKDACNYEHLEYLLTTPVINPVTDIILQEYGDDEVREMYES
jgi:hypothetical protein